MANSKKIFIFAGEPSGDLHGSRLTHFLKKRIYLDVIRGVAGPKMRNEGVHGALSMEDFEVMGFSDVVRSLPKLCSHFFHVRNSILKSNPDAVILIDYPGFNLKLAKSLRKHQYQGKIIHYISPSVWAWGKHRIGEMEKTLDLLLTIYPFEAEYFSDTTLKVDYVGSPLQEYLSLHDYQEGWQRQLGFPVSNHLVALFPGSRKGEIIRNLPIILDAAVQLKQVHPEIIFGISCFNETVKKVLEENRERYPILKNALFHVPKEYSYELMRDSRCAIAKSGTVTLELALHKCPTVVIYQLSRLNRFYAQYLLKVNLPHYCIVNILAKKEVFPELIEKGLNTQNLFSQIQSLYIDGEKRQNCIQSCHEIDSSLGTNDANQRAAESIARCLQ